MNLYNNPVPTGISNLRFQGSYFNPPPPALTQPELAEQTGWDVFKELFWDAKMKTQLAIALIKIVGYWLYKHL